MKKKMFEPSGAVVGWGLFFREFSAKITFSEGKARWLFFRSKSLLCVERWLKSYRFAAFFFIFDFPTDFFTGLFVFLRILPHFLPPTFGAQIWYIFVCLCRHQSPFIVYQDWRRLYFLSPLSFSVCFCVYVNVSYVIIWVKWYKLITTFRVLYLI